VGTLGPVCVCMSVCVCVCEAATRLEELESWYFSVQREGSEGEIGKGQSDTQALCAFQNHSFLFSSSSYHNHSYTAFPLWSRFLF